MLPSTEEITAARPKARANIEAGRLPSTDVACERRTDSGHRSYCINCGEVIKRDEIWFRLLGTVKNSPALGAPPVEPELHAACYAAWRAEVVAATATRVGLRLLPAPDDPPINSPEFQRTLGEFTDTLSSTGITFQQRSAVFDSATADGYHLAEYALQVSRVAIPTLGAVLIAWIRSRARRSVTVKLADIFITARTAEEVGDLLQSIEESRRSERDP
ncbi:MAG TPA: hypothetical protein VMU67_03720 [Steroidobacteraceae bacterium]|nr:hypothetical protein [Steroidobacteraceae bacterium]